LAAGQGRQAAAEFQKILDHRGIVVSDPIGALAHLQLGRALALSGDKAKAKTAYQDFLVLWKNAERDIPILKRARAEYANLNESHPPNYSGRRMPSMSITGRCEEGIRQADAGELIDHEVVRERLRQRGYLK
jgi:hypothetical protein